MAGPREFEVKTVSDVILAQIKAQHEQSKNALKMQQAQQTQELASDHLIELGLLKERFQQGTNEAKARDTVEAQEQDPSTTPAPINQARIPQQVNKTTGSQQLTLDVNQIAQGAVQGGVQGGAAAQSGLQQAVGEAEGAVQPNITTQRVTEGSQTVRDPFGVTQLPTAQRTTETRPNVLTARDAALLQVERQKMNAVVQESKVKTALNVIDKFGTGGSRLAAKVAQGQPITAQDIEGAGSTLKEVREDAEIERIKTDTKAQKQKIRQSEELFRFQKFANANKAKKILIENGSPLTLENFPLSRVMGFPPTVEEATVLANQLQGGIDTINAQLNEPVLLGIGRKGFANIDMDGVEFMWNVGQPAARLGLVVVKREGQMTTVPIQAVLAELAVDQGRVTTTVERKKEAKGRLRNWGLTGDPQQPDFMNYYKTKILRDMQEYRGTQAEADALESVGVARPPVTRDDPTVQKQREEEQRQIERGLEEFQRLQKQLGIDLGF